MSKPRNKIVILGIAVLLLSISLYFRTRESTYEPSEEQRRLTDFVGLIRERAEEQEQAERERAEAEEAQAATDLSPEQRRAAWEAIRSAIEEARNARVSELRNLAREAAEPSAATTTDATAGTLDPTYIRDAMRDMNPLLSECYELAREDEPALQGRLVLNYVIGGEPEVGGVVEEVLIDEASELRHPLLDECVRETIYTLELPAPDAGGQVRVSYPLIFAPDEADEDGTTER